MNPSTQAVSNDLDQLKYDAEALLSATAGAAEDKIGEARRRVGCVLERGREIYADACGKAVEGSKAADIAMHQNVYQAIAVGVGVGAIIGYFFASRCRCTSDSL